MSVALSRRRPWLYKEIYRYVVTQYRSASLMALIKEGMQASKTIKSKRKEKILQRAEGTAWKDTSKQGLLKELRDSQGKSYPKKHYKPVPAVHPSMERSSSGKRSGADEPNWVGRAHKGSKDREGKGDVGEITGPSRGLVSKMERLKNAVRQSEEEQDPRDSNPRRNSYDEDDSFAVQRTVPKRDSAPSYDVEDDSAFSFSPMDIGMDSKTTDSSPIAHDTNETTEESPPRKSAFKRKESRGAGSSRVAWDTTETAEEVPPRKSSFKRKSERDTGRSRVAWDTNETTRERSSPATSFARGNDRGSKDFEGPPSTSQGRPSTSQTSFKAAATERNGGRRSDKPTDRRSEAGDSMSARYVEPDHATSNVSRDPWVKTAAESVHTSDGKVGGEQYRPIDEDATTSRAAAFSAKDAKFDQLESSDLPISIPYTTAASVFLYGYNSVIAALKGRRRKFYQLYAHPRFLSRNELDAQEATALAEAAGVPVHDTSDQLQLMDKMSGGRPHNGLVLEASRLPAPPVESLGRPDRNSGMFPVKTQRQSAEDVAINGAPSGLSYPGDSWRRPFIVMLDGILDPENIGSIVRSAHFYGVDAVAVATNTCATLTSATLAKASSGACEAIQLLALPSPGNFLYDSVRAGWRVYAAVAPPSPEDYAALPLKGQGATTKSSSSQSATSRYLTTASLAKMSPLALHPTILVLGAEGTGLRDNLKRRAEYFISIEQGVRADTFQDVGVDSMNVGVAAGVLMESFMRKPTSIADKSFAATGRGSLGF